MLDERRSRILVVDDDLVTIEVLYAVLGERHEVLFATDGEQALSLAASATPDLILLDVLMPDIDGYEVCARLKGDDRTAAIPVIFVTGLGDVDAEMRGLECGAVDYLTKPISPALVRLRVRNQLALQQARQQLESLAQTDGLTECFNRRYFDATLESEILRHRRSGAPLSLLMLDVDHFKLYNDTYGHVAGDDCLRMIARQLRAACRRRSDVAARYGGEEFAVILAETGAAGAWEVADSIRTAVHGANVPHATSEVAERVTISVGVVSVSSPDLVSCTDLLIRTDEQLYRAKTDGRNRVHKLDLVRSSVPPEKGHARGAHA